jgi:hypothetical protein
MYIYLYIYTHTHTHTHTQCYLFYITQCYKQSAWFVNHFREPKLRNRYVDLCVPIPEAARSASARFMWLRVLIPPGAWTSVVSVVCCQGEVSGWGWSLVQRSPTECGVSECDREASIMKPWLSRACCTMGIYVCVCVCVSCCTMGIYVCVCVCVLLHHGDLCVRMCVCVLLHHGDLCVRMCVCVLFSITRTGLSKVV